MDYKSRALLRRGKQQSRIQEDSVKDPYYLDTVFPLKYKNKWLMHYKCYVWNYPGVEVGAWKIFVTLGRDEKQEWRLVTDLKPENVIDGDLEQTIEVEGAGEVHYTTVLDVRMVKEREDLEKPRMEHDPYRESWNTSDYVKADKHHNIGWS